MMSFLEATASELSLLESKILIQVIERDPMLLIQAIERERLLKFIDDKYKTQQMCERAVTAS